MNDSLRIALLGYGYSHHIQRLAEGLAKRGHKVHIITASKHGPYPAILGTTFETFDSNQNYISRIRQVRKILNRIKPDILHSHFVNYGGFIGLATNFHPHLMSAWGCDILNIPKESKLMHSLIKIAVRSVDGLLPVSKELQSELTTFSKPGLLNEVVNWGVDIDHFNPRNKSVNFRKKWNIENEIVVLSPRVLEPHYNQHLLIEAWPMFKLKFREARLIVIKMRADFKYQVKLENKARDLDVFKDIIWIEEIDYDSLPSLYNAVDILVSIPSTDGTPMTVLEAMACGTAIVASNTKSLREWLLPTCHGIIIKALNAHAVGEALVELANQTKADTSKQRAASRALVIERVSREKSLKELEDIYIKFKDQVATGWLKTLSNIFGTIN